MKQKSKEVDLPGFPSVFTTKNHEDNFETYPGSKNPKTHSKKGGGFQAMGLSYEVLKGITKRGYKIPTPIQRKTIPLILEGRDVVAMAKTGSGKTACFLIPLFEKLKRREPTKGARALILSPTRELAIQTFKFIKELGRFMDLKIILVLGGDSMDSQFSAIHTCPDVIVATPGRFLHLCVEMDLKLNSIEYAVFDEADRLFEMGFGEQLNETLHRLPESKQMVMFSATLPKLLVDFAKAGLCDPVLIRLDVESKLPEGLTLKFLSCRPDERYTSLIVLLKYIIPKDAQTVVFAGTQHHVELLSFILTQSDITNTSIYSSLDPSARKINTAKFVHKKVSVLIVTDVAARGIDIPSLDYVINVHFPGKPKLFVHRVGRCARAGRQGTAYTIFSTDDQAHLLDLHLFLNRPFNLADNSSIGIIPQDILEEEHLPMLDLLKSHHITGVYRTSENAYKKYISSRPVASADSNKRVKTIKFFTLKHLEEFMNVKPEADDDYDDDNSKQKYTKNSLDNKQDEQRKLLEEKHDLIIKMRNFRPSGTVFELNPHHKSVPLAVMKEKRANHSKVIEKFRNQMKELDKKEEEKSTMSSKHPNNTQLTESNDTDIENVFNKVVTEKKRKNMDDLYKGKLKKKKKQHKKDEEHFVPYHSADRHTEEGFAVNSFQQQAQNAEFSVVDRNQQEVKHTPGMKKWDRIKKKMVAVQDPRSGKIKTESGMWIPASFKTGRYTEWKQKSKIDEQLQREDGSDNENKMKTHEQRYPVSRWARHNANIEAKRRMGTGDSELKNPEQIVKQRLRVDFAKRREQENKIKKAQNRKKFLKKVKGKSNKGKK